MFKDALPEKLKAILKKIIPVVTEERFYLAGGTGLAFRMKSQTRVLCRSTPFRGRK